MNIDMFAAAAAPSVGSPRANPKPLALKIKNQGSTNSSFNKVSSFVKFQTKFKAIAMANIEGEIPGLQRITIQNSKGEKLVGILNDTGSSEICILCHGLRSSKESLGIKYLANALAEAGLSTYRFDFSGNGESEGEFSYGEYWREVGDLRDVILYWRSQGRVVNYIIGHSKGGNAVILYSSKYGDVPTVINASGRCFLDKGLKSRLGEDYMERLNRDGFVLVNDKKGTFKVSKESLMARLNTDMKAAARSIPNTCRVMTIHGTDDEVIRVQDAYEFAKEIPNHKLKIVEGANHAYSNHLSELKNAALEFIQGEGFQSPQFTGSS